MSTIGALAPWFGAKRTLAAKIVAALGPHRAYWEPFCGSMAVLLAKSQCSMETVNDLHGDLINLARVVQHDTLGPRLYRQLRRTLMHEAFMHEAAERWKERGNVPAGHEPDVDRAADFFLSSWMGRNGVSGTQSYNQGFSARYTKNGGHAATRFCSAVDSIPSWRRRLRGVTILNRDGFDIIAKIEDEPGVAMYVDPPYVKKGAKYVHDFESEDHHRLADALGRFRRTRVVVSCYDDPLVRELYRGWSFIECPTTKALVNQGMRDTGGAVVAPEVLIVNSGKDGLFGGDDE